MYAKLHAFNAKSKCFVTSFLISKNLWFIKIIMSKNEFIYIYIYVINFIFTSFLFTKYYRKSFPDLFYKKMLFTICLHPFRRTAAHQHNIRKC